jgi:hypothetical protein
MDLFLVSIIPGNVRPEQNVMLLNQSFLHETNCHPISARKNLCVYRYYSTTFSQNYSSVNRKHQILRHSQAQAQPAEEVLPHCFFL